MANDNASKTLVIHEINEECVEYWIGGNLLIEANHDDHGWSGMEGINKALTLMAEACGLSVQGSDNEDDHRHDR